MQAPQRRGILLELAAEGIVPVLGGCAGVLMGGREAGLAGALAGQMIEKGINFFGARIIDRWQAWFASQPAEVRLQALADVANLSIDEARQQASSVLITLAPQADASDLSLALDYLSMIPQSLDRAMVKDPQGERSLPMTASFAEPGSLFQLLPNDIPPFRVPSDLAGTPYRLTALLGSGGFGAVYKAATATLQHLPLAIKFCLDRSLIAALQLERSNLERLMKSGGEGWAKRIVRLYGYDLEHRTPYLVYEYVPGGDLLHHLQELRSQTGRGLDVNEVLHLIRQIADSLAFAHAQGLVHRDLKPANILVDGDSLKLADFGLGGVMAVRATTMSQVGRTTVSLLSAADQASLFRGAGTPLYMAPEQRRGSAPDPRHDLYSLGVIWFQLLVGDMSRELHAGWAKELTTRFHVPKLHVDLIEQCVGWIDDRPKNAGELVALLQVETSEPSQQPVQSRVESGPEASAAPTRRRRVRSLLAQIDRSHSNLSRKMTMASQSILVSVIWAGLALGTFFLLCVVLGILTIALKASS